MAIESRWFRVHRTGSGTLDDPYRPEYSDRLEAFSEFQLNESPVMVMRAYAEPAVLDEIADQPRASEVPRSAALKAFNDSEHPSNAGIEATDEDDLERRFRVGVKEADNDGE